MRWQTTAILALVLVLVGGFYYVYEVRLGPGREEAAARKGRVFSADSKDVAEIELKRAGETVRLKREGEGWELLEPVRARGSRPTADEILANVLTAKIDRQIDPNPKSPADFGLDKPAAETTLTLKDGKKLGLALKDVSGFEVTLPDSALAAERSDGVWRLTRPAPLAADGETIAEFLDKLAAQKVTEFVADGAVSTATYGLDRPTRVTIYTGKDKDRVGRTLLLGRVDAAKKGVYAMRPGEASVLLVPEEIAKQVPKNVAVLRNKVVAAVDRDKLAKLEIESPKGTVAAARDKDQWKLVAPQALPADQVEVGALLTKVRDLRAQGFLGDDAGGIARYLAKPQVRVTLTEQGGAVTTVLLAPSGETRGGGPMAYAAVAGKGPVVLVDGKALDDLSRSATELRDRRLLGDLTPRDVKRVRVRAGGQTAVLERKGEDDWRLMEPTKGAANATKVTDLLYTLRALRWKDVVAPEGQDAARWGVDAPTLEIALFRGDGGEIATLVVGKREGDLAYVRTKAQPAIYSVESRVLGPAPKVPDDFKG
ncbi:MAG: hypothetical protein DMD76_28915 [Candidatus Rokuibacteriota bacterium]|nr:MAG: hypothetical protein DMD76_28915 [Candidatus Rokubacteria bacterium]